MLSKFYIFPRNGISAQDIYRIQIPMSWNTMEEYEEDDEFKYIVSKKVDNDSKSM